VSLRSALLSSLIVAAGCYNPSLSSPGFFCHAGDDPACPDGQQCVQGRCVSRSGHPGSDGGADGGSTDMARMSGLTGCSGLITCINNCAATDMTCPKLCQNNTTSTGNALFNNLIQCVLTFCPDQTPGDICYDPSSSSCTTCFTNAQSDPSECGSDLSACQNDLP